MKNNKQNKRQRKSGILICCEDTKSCKNYLEVIKKSDVYITSGNIRKAKKRYKNKNIKEYYFVFDTESKEQEVAFKNNLNKAKKEGFETIVSNPCYEYWLLLHFKYSSSPFENYDKIKTALNKELEGLDIEYKKEDREQITQYFIPKMETAITNAKQIAEQNRGEGDEYPNPSTQLHILVEKLKI